MGSGEEARLEDGLAGTDRLLHVDRAQQPVLWTCSGVLLEVCCESTDMEQPRAFLQHVQRDLHKGRVDDLCLQRIWIDLACEA